MSEDIKTHTAGEVDLLIAVARVEAMQKIGVEAFQSHAREDNDHFERLYEAEKRILCKLDNIPQKFTDCSEKLKTEILKIADTRYTPDKEFTIFKTKVVMGVTLGTLLGTIIATILSLFIAASKAGVVP